MGSTEFRSMEHSYRQFCWNKQETNYSRFLLCYVIKSWKNIRNCLCVTVHIITKRFFVLCVKQDRIANTHRYVVSRCVM